MKKRILSLLMASIMVIGLAACGGKEDPKPEATPDTNQEQGGQETEAPAEQPPAAAEGEKILYSNTGPVEFFEVPWWNLGQYVHSKLLFETLIGIDNDMNPTTETGMAESYELSEDGLQLTITLRDGLKWHDGQDVTLDDVVWSMEQIMTPGAGMANNTLKQTCEGIEGVQDYLDGKTEHPAGIELVDDKTIVLKFATVQPSVMLAMSLFPILPKHCLEGVDMTQIQQDAFWQSPIGSGPFKLEEVKIGEYATFAPFEDYWDGVADFKILLNASSAESDDKLVTNVKAGLIDYAYTKMYSDVQALRDVEGVTIDTVPVNYTRWFMVNQYPKAAGETNPLSDKRVRQAIAYAIDKATICEQIFEGAAMPGTGTLTPTGSNWKVEGLEEYAYNPDKAKELLAEAGWDSNRELKLAYYYTDQQTVDLMAIVQQQLAQVGIKVNPYLLEGDVPGQLNTAPTADGLAGVQWDLAYGALSALSPLDYYSRFADGSSGTWHGPYDETLGTMVNEMLSTADVEKQMATYAKIEEYYADEIPYIALYYQPVWVVTSDKVAGNVSKWGNPQFYMQWDIQNWTLK
ncbi:MAG: ABC transporter substrate-binding protein [Lachnospiraceae bacterium]|nr:ABC transporter substrate-binding protein [Lachnospiraceae bacterium]